MKLFRREVSRRSCLSCSSSGTRSISRCSRWLAASARADREAPIRLDYKFGARASTGAQSRSLWDTAAIFYRLRLLRLRAASPCLARKVSRYRPDPPRASRSCRSRPESRTRRPGSDRTVWGARHAGTGTEMAAAPGMRRDAAGDRSRETSRGMGTGSRSDRIARVIARVPSEVVAFVDQDARPSDGWAAAALSLFGDPSVGGVVGPAVPHLTGSPAYDAAGILSESRLGVGGARIRSHVGRLRQVSDFPAANLFVRTTALRRAFDEGHPLDDQLCSVLRRRQGLAVLCSPDVVVTIDPFPLFRPYLRTLHRLGRDRGSRFGSGRPPRARHLAPRSCLSSYASSRGGHVIGGRVLVSWISVMLMYLAVLAGFGGVVAVLHRRLGVAALAVGGAAASHAAFGLGCLEDSPGGSSGTLRHTRPLRTTLSPRRDRGPPDGGGGGGTETVFAAAGLGEPLQVGVDHHRDEVLEVDRRLPSEALPGLGGVAHQQVDLGRADEGADRCGRARPGRGPRARRPAPPGARPCWSRRWPRRSPPARPAGASATWRRRSRRRSPSRAARRGCPACSVSARPSLMRATPSVTLRVTNSRPRRGDSWLKRIPEQAKRS